MCTTDDFCTCRTEDDGTKKNSPRHEGAAVAGGAAVGAGVGAAVTLPVLGAIGFGAPGVAAGTYSRPIASRTNVLTSPFF